MQFRKFVVAASVLGVAAMMIVACSSDEEGPLVSSDVVDGAADAALDAVAVDGGACVPAIPKAPADRSNLGCDPKLQDCSDPCNPKCTFWSIDPTSSTSGRQFAACGPEIGTAAIDEECSRPNNVLGEDTCAKGFFCSALGKPATSTSTRVCRPTCKATADCAAGEFCLGLTPTAEAVDQGGVCVPSCDPFATPCRAGESCRFALDVVNLGQLVCGARTGTTAVGAPCTLGVEEACVNGSMCASLASDAGTSGTCRAYCDDAHPCEADAGTCQVIGGLAFKLCVP